MSNWVTEASDPEGWARKIRERSRPYGDCLIWTERLDRYGYGVFIVGPGMRQTGAHRAAWLALRGPIEHGMVIDHLCRNRACVNVDHMEVVTVRTNTNRGKAGYNRHRPATHCVNGHEFTPENTAWREPTPGRARRECLTCRAERRRKADRAA